MDQISDIHRKNLRIWILLLAGMLVLTAVVYFLEASDTFRPIPDSRQYNRILFITAIILASAILILKRSVFLPEKIVRQAGATGESREQMTAAVMGRIRTNYLIIWSLADAIMILGFIGYILATDFSDFLIFAIVGVYALLINMPREAVLHRTVNMLDQPG